MLLCLFAFLSGLYLCYYIKGFFSQHTASLLEISGFDLWNYFSPRLWFAFFFFPPPLFSNILRNYPYLQQQFDFEPVIKDIVTDPFLYLTAFLEI